MGRFARRVPAAALAAFLLMCAGCGGGAAGYVQPPPPAPDFSLNLSASTLSVAQGNASTPINMSVAGQNGFSGAVNVTLNGLPSGVTSNPASPFTVMTGESLPVVFGVAASVATGNIEIVAQGTSGAVSHSATLILTVQSSLGYTARVYANPALQGGPAPYKFLAYDQKRQLVYLSAPAGIDVFDVQKSAFRPTGLTLYCPSFHSTGPCPDDDVREMALLPDGSRLAAADFGSQNLYVFDPDTPNTPAIATWFSTTPYGPARVAPTNNQTVFVALSAEATSAQSCTQCLAELDLAVSPPTIQSFSQAELANITASPLAQADAAGDRVVLAFATATGGPLGIWDAVHQTFNLTATTEIASDLSVSADGNLFATAPGAAIEVHSIDANLQATVVSSFSVPSSAQVPNHVAVPGMSMHPTGALVYQPFLTGAPPPPPQPGVPPAPGPQSGIDILSARSGELLQRVFLPEPLAATSADIDGRHAGFIALDGTGQNIFAITTSGLTIVQLTHVPLGIGTVLPAAGPAAGGATLTIRGSGFQQGMTGTLGGKTVSVVFKDMNTITVTTPALAAGAQRLLLRNPDGETTALDAAYVSN